MLSARNFGFAALSGRRFLTTSRRPVEHVLSLHRNFPYTLYKVNPGERSNIVDAATSPRSKHFYDSDEAENLVKGRVYPSVTSQVVPEPVLFPHTLEFQQYSRMFMDQYYESLDDGLEPTVPYIFRIPKGTQLPDSLILVHHSMGMFSMQPVESLSLEEFNNALEEFYSSHAEKVVAERWFEEHEYGSGDVDGDPSTWR